MDKRLEKALEFSNFRMILTTRQKNLEFLMNNKLILSYGGGVFKVNKELISFTKTLIDLDEHEFVFIDSNEMPILITDIPQFLKESIEKYRKALEQYYQSYQKLSEARKIRKVIDWNGEDKES